MNIKKIEADFLKGLFSTQSFKYTMTEYEGRVGYSDGCYVALVYPINAYVKCDRKFDFEKILDKKERVHGIYTYTITSTGHNLARYDRSDEQGHVYIDVKYIKYFSPNAEYMIADRKDPVYVYENDDLVGIICPVNISEGVK